MTITSLNSSDAFRAAVRGLTKLAVMEGLITKSPCACGATNALAHHDDYGKPFDVDWLCGRCHAKRHQALGWGYKGCSNYFGGRYDTISRRNLVRARQAVFTSPSSLRGFLLLVSHLRGKGVKLPKEFVLK